MALPLFPGKPRVSFAMLEQVADTSLDRLSYQTGNHHVHASARTLDLTSDRMGDTVYISTGRTKTGFEAPATAALIAAVASTNAVIHGLDDMPDPMHLVAVSALVTMSVRCVELMGEAEEFILRRI